MKFVIEIMDQRIEGNGKNLLDSLNKANTILTQIIKERKKVVENPEFEVRLSFAKYVNVKKCIMHIFLLNI